MIVKLYTEPAFGTLNIIFYQKNDGKRFVVKPLQLEFVECKEGEAVDPTIKLPDYVANEFLQCMADEIYKRGIKPSQQPILENEMTAVKYHLEDMRTLVFKKD